MRFLLTPSPSQLPKGWSRIYTNRIKAVSAFATHDLRSKYIRKNASWGFLKKWLARVSSDKCWYCEANSKRAPFDVDHFRPKLGITIEGSALPGHDGYYWLAYEWRNFRLSCQRCNRPEKDNYDTLHGKANEFPIQDEAQRCFFPADPITAESPRLLDPCLEADCRLLVHAIDGEVKPAASVGTWEHQRARYTIDRLGFNEWNTPESKRSQWQTLALLLAAVGKHAPSAVITEISKYLSCEHEYSSFFRSAIGTHRDKDWVEALF